MIEAALLFRGSDTEVFSWVYGVIVALLGLAFCLTRRSRTTVGADGITISWGVGRGRTHPWDQIQWIDMRETRGRHGTVRTARITLTDGRRRSLPTLSHSELHPNPDLAANFQRVVSWWELSTDQTTRVQWPIRPRDRLTPEAFGVVLGLVITVGIGVAVLASH
ncbi:PH domain-containing protein [Streptomyces sp. NPDC058691]|uniref:PH domain-containing protein n=1 Tax=Streptomyces sp. NPDC058691 TaxID=3346601 RepID=UPI0036661D6C